MSGAALRLNLEQFAGYARARSDKIAHLSLREPLTACRVLLVSEARDCFHGAHAPDGTPWLALKNPSRRRGGASAKPLRDKGLLMASVTAHGQGHVEELTATSLVLGTNLDYARPQQDGARIYFPARKRQKPWVFQVNGGMTVFTRKIKAHSVTIPPRPFLGFSARALDRIDKIFAEWLGKNI